MVPHSRHRGIQQSADMLRNRSTPLKLEKKILITIIFTIMCTMCRQRRCGCRRWCPQPHNMDRLRRFWCNSSVLWTYCHRPVARFPRRRLGRQSKYGRRGGDLRGSTSNIFFAISIGANYSCGGGRTPKPSARVLAHGVGMTSMCWVGVSSRHRQWYRPCGRTPWLTPCVHK